MHLVRGGGDVLRVAAVPFAAHQADRVGVRPRAVVERGVDHHPAPHQAGVDARADRRDAARHVGALDAREVERAAPARPGRRVPGTAVRPLTGPQVGVVQGDRGHLDQDVPGRRDRYGHLGPFEDLRPSVLRDPYRSHGLGQSHRHDLLAGILIGELPPPYTDQ